MSVNVNGMQQAQGLNRVGRFAAAQPSKVAEDLSSTVGRLVGTSVRDTFKPSALLKDAAISGLSNVPFDGLFSSQAYRRGDIKANQYVARVIANSVGFGAWTIGGAIAGALLAPIGLPALAVGILGFAAGMTTQGLFDRFLGHPLAKKLADVIPEKDVKGLADGFTKYIANPLNDHLWRPLIDTLKGHKVLAAGVAGALALKFPGAAKVIGKEALTMGGGMAVGMGLEMGVLTPMFGANDDPFDKKKQDAGVAIDPKWVKVFNTVRQQLQAQGATPAQATELAKQHFVKTMVQNGASQQDAEQLVAQIASAAAPATQAAPKASGAAVAPGMLFGR